MSNSIIFGEMHTAADRDRIETEIIKEHSIEPFKFILSEELGPHRYYNKLGLRRGFTNREWSISDRTFRLALELNIAAIGIDSWEDDTYREDKKGPGGLYLDCRRSFRLREKLMTSTIQEFLPRGRLAVIVGDAHLRTIRTLVCGEPSLITRTFAASPKVNIIRAPHGEIA